MGQRTKRGFTIVELLVTLGVAGLVLALVYQVFIAQRRGYTVQEEVAEAQQNARIAADELARLIKNIGNGVDRPNGQEQLLHCGPYAIVFNSDLEGGAAADAGTAVNSLYPPAGTGLHTVPATFGTGAETYLLTLRPTGGRHYDLVRVVYSGGGSRTDEVAGHLNVADMAGTAVPLFRYWGQFNSSTPEWLTTVDATTSSRLAAGARLDDLVERVDIQIVAETRAGDRLANGTNAGYRQAVVQSNVTPRNLVPCPFIQATAAAATFTAGGLHTVGTTTHTFTSFFKGAPEQGRTITFQLVNAAGDAVTALTATSGVTDAMGRVTATIDWADCSVFLPLLAAGGSNLVYTLTATIGEPPSLNTPLGTCDPESATTTITVTPGGPVNVVMVESPVPDILATCSGQTDAVFQVQDACGIPVPLAAGDRINFSARDTAGTQVGTVTPATTTTLGIITSTRTPATPGSPWRHARRVVYRPPASGAWPATAPVRSVTAPYRFPLLLRADAVGSFVSFAEGPFSLEARPFAIANLTNAISTAAHLDCPTLPVEDTFEMRDCHGNWVGPLDVLATPPAARVDLTMGWDTAMGSQPGSGLPQGRVYPIQNNAAPASLPGNYWNYPLFIQQPRSPAAQPWLYSVLYEPPDCTLGPGQSFRPSYGLAIQGATPATSPARTASKTLTVGACATCEVTADPPVMSECTDSTTVTVSGCDLSGKMVRIRVAGSGARNGSFHPTTAGVDFIDVQLQPGAGPTESVATATLYLGNAQDGDTLTVSAESVARAPNGVDPAWRCGNTVAVPVSSECQKLEIYSDPGYSRIVGNDPGNENCLARMSLLYFEVDDCQFAGLASRLNKAVTVYTISEDGSVDKIEVDLEPVAGYDPPLKFRSVRGVWIEEGNAIDPSDDVLNYRPGRNVKLVAGYKDPNDPGDDWTINIATPAAQPLPLQNHDCEKAVDLQPPLPICFPNAITSGGGGIWRGNFQIHWGDVVIRGNVVMAPTPKFITKDEFGQFDNQPFSGTNNTDRFVDIYVGRTIGNDPTTGNFIRNNGTPIANPTPLQIDRPFVPGGAGHAALNLKAAENYGSYFRNISYEKISSMMRELDYDVMKNLAKARGAYWYTLNTGNIYGRAKLTLRNPATGQMASLEEVLSLPGPGIPNAYYNGQFLFVDSFATADPGPLTAGAAIDATPTASLPQFKIGGIYTEGVIYIAGSVEYTSGGGGKAISARTPPNKDDLTYYPLTASPAWKATDNDLPIRPEPTFPASTFTLADINLNGGIYMDGEATFSGSPKIYGAITTERGFGGTGSPEIWYNYVLNATQENLSLCIACCTLEVSPPSRTLFINDLLTLTGVNRTGTLIWRTEDPLVASLSPVAGTANATVRALSRGNARILAVDENNCIARSEIEVLHQCDVFGIVPPNPPVLSIPGVGTFTATSAPGAVVRFSSADPAIASIDPVTGMATARAPGFTTIRAQDTAFGCQDDILLQVVCPSLSIAPAAPVVTAGQTLNLILSGAGGPATWTSSDPAVATVDATGRVTALRSGTVNVTAAWPAGAGCSATTTVRVVCPLLTLTAPPGPLPAGTSTVLTLAGAGGAPSWASSNPAVATVDAAGRVTAVTPGTATITATWPVGSNCSQQVQVQVVCPALSVAPNPVPPLTPGQTTTVALTGAGGAPTWTSSDATVAAVNASGLVTAGATGAATVTGTWPAGTGCSASAAVNVQCPALSVTVAPAAGSLEVGQTYTLTVSGGRLPYSWSVAPAVGTITPTGDTSTATFLPTSPGPAAVTVTDRDGCPQATNLTVTCPVVSISWVPAAPAFEVGTTYTLSALPGSLPVTWSIDPASTGGGTLTPGAGGTAAFVPTTAGTLILRAQNAASGCGDTVTTAVLCPLPQVTTRWPVSGQVYGTSSTAMGPLLPWHAEARDGIGPDPADTLQIQRVRFTVSPDPMGLGPRDEINVEYCGFGGNDCFATPGDVSGWPSGVYTLTAEARNACGATATDAVTITVDNP